MKWQWFKNTKNNQAPKETKPILLIVSKREQEGKRREGEGRSGEGGTPRTGSFWCASGITSLPSLEVVQPVSLVISRDFVKNVESQAPLKSNE